MSENRPVRVRFAPSPTGRLHIGGARTALFNWALARHFGGQFILRIEDTDTERNSDESLQSILDSMRWLGIDWDEGPDKEGDFGPYFQQQRMDKYQAAIQCGIAEGWLYRCFASAEEIGKLVENHRNSKTAGRWEGPSRDLPVEEAERRADAGEDFVLRFRVPLGEEVVIKDHIRGNVTFRTDEVEDWVAVRANGMPTYNFCCAIDDADMQISHVIRGEEHLVNTPKQVLLAAALGVSVPDFAHVPLILGEDGKKLSKRTGDTALGDYISKGYPADALFNFLSLLGFSIDDKTTVFSRDELVQHFDLKRISKGGALFDTDKLHYLCGEYIRRMDVVTLTDAVLPSLEQAGLAANCSREWLEHLVRAMQERLGLLNELPEKAAYLFGELVELDKKAAKAVRNEQAIAALNHIAANFEAADVFPPADWSGWMKEQAGQLEVGLGKVMKPLRAALSGTLGGPELVDILALLGKERSIKRIRAAVEQGQSSGV
jgi:nondiscriminating glutamyl-tRNA synthetase